LKLKRREFLQYVGAGAASIYFDSPSLAAPKNEPKQTGKRPSFLTDFKSPAYCLPLPGDGGDARSDAKKFANFIAKDELVFPVNYQIKRLASWGDVLGANKNSIRVGYNCDHLSLIKRANFKNEYFLVINHEYVSNLPWSQSLKEVTGQEVPGLELSQTEDFKVLKEGDMLIPLLPKTNLGRYKELSEKISTLAELTLDEMGVSILHLQNVDGELRIVKDSKLNKRISTTTRQNIAESISFSFVGPGNNFLPPPRGTMANCSGATTPWNTALTCEENIQDISPEWITPDGQEFNQERFRINGLLAKNNSGLPIEWLGLGTCLKAPLDNRTYGWVCEVGPETGELRKFITLGRFRHENVTIKAQVARKLRLYMGDDRRGGHVWRFESKDPLSELSNPDNSKLLEQGVLSVAKFNPGFSGNWIPLTLETPLQIPDPETVAEGYLFLPARPGGGPVVVTNRDHAEIIKLLKSKYNIISPTEWINQIEIFCKKPFSRITLGDLVVGKSDEVKQLIILMDAFLMANAAGGTPTARPEDLEVHPFDNSIYIAFTDNTGKEQGSPDIRIFPDSKRINSRQYGAVYRIEEQIEQNKFTWGKFISSGEVAESGAGFACVDNLAFDSDGNLWFVTDISTDVQNHRVNNGDQEAEGEKFFSGIFGNSSLFVVPTSGPFRGVPRLFAMGPMESELTGIKFYEDENFDEFLLLAVQHPGENQGIGKGLTEERVMQIKTRSGENFMQKRKVPLGSNFPDGGTSPPKPTVFVVHRKTDKLT